MENDGTVSVPSNISINGREFSIDEAQNLIDLGSKTRDFEKQWNTPVDSLMPAYTKSREELRTLQAERDQARQEIASFKAKQEAGVETQTDVTKARQAAKQLGIVLDEDLKSGGYLRKDDLESWYTERRTKERQDEQAVNSVLAEADKLAAEINATDAPAKFNKKAVLAYAGAYGITDLRKAYEEMNEDILKPWKEAQLTAARKPGLKTLKPQSGNKQPEEKRPQNETEQREALRQALWGSGEGQ